MTSTMPRLRRVPHLPSSGSALDREIDSRIPGAAFLESAVTLLALAVSCAAGAPNAPPGVVPVPRNGEPAEACSCSPPPGPPRVFRASRDSPLERECPPELGEARAPLTLELAAVEPCVVGFTSGRCARPVPADLVLSIRNRLPVRVVLSAQEAPHLVVTGRPVPPEEAESCRETWDIGRCGFPYYERTIPLEHALLVEPLGTTTMAVDLGLSWPETALPCFSGWYSFVAVLPASADSARLVWARPVNWWRPWEQDWRRILRRLDPAAGTVAQISDVIPDYRGTCTESEIPLGQPRLDPPNCLPAEALSALLGEVCIWPCGGAPNVTSNEVFVWIEAEHGRGLGAGDRGVAEP